MTRRFTSPRWALSSLVALALLLASCGTAPDIGTGDGDSGGAGTIDSAVFPRGLSVASPLSRGGAEPGGSGGSLVAQQLSDVTNYQAFGDAIEAILDGTTPIADGFDPSGFLRSSSDANCYGPQLAYSSHPDGATDGTLPGGDLGLWTASETRDFGVSEACAAAQLNRRMSGIESQAFSALTSLAVMIVVTQDAGLDLPDAGSSLDLTSEMNAAGLTGTTFTGATLAQSAGGVWTYQLDMSYSEGSGTVDVRVRLDHAETSDGIEGILWYAVPQTMGFGNCVSATQSTWNGSLAYQVQPAAVALEARTGSYCGADNDGRAAAGEVLDVTRVYSGTTTDGWADNFAIFTAEFDPTTLVGSYAYAWQAGVNDSHARALDVVVSDAGESGTAFFGFRDPLPTMQPALLGMICFWAGGSHDVSAYLQKQTFRYDAATDAFPAESSEVAYLPTNGCAYDGSGAFKIDTDLDGDLGDETALPATTAGLASTDADSDGTGDDANANGVLDLVEDAGFTQPVAPTPGT